MVLLLVVIDSNVWWWTAPNENWASGPLLQFRVRHLLWSTFLSVNKYFYFCLSNCWWGVHRISYYLMKKFECFHSRVSKSEWNWVCSFAIFIKSPSTDTNLMTDRLWLCVPDTHYRERMTTLDFWAIIYVIEHKIVSFFCCSGENPASEHEHSSLVADIWKFSVMQNKEYRNHYCWYLIY